MDLLLENPSSFDSHNNIILVVDDNPTNLEVISTTLNNNGFKVAVATDGESTLELAKYRPPNLILLDVMMPGIDGFETCRRLKQDSATTAIPIIFMTALNDTVNKVKGLSLGAVDYITKPIRSEEVLARIKVHLHLQSLTNTLENQNLLLQEEIEQRKLAEQGLQDTLEELKATQKQLIEVEKMAALGNLVAGVAHEINTPVGTGITVASTLADETQALLQAFTQGNLRRSILQEYLELAQESSQLILRNLQRAGELVQSFKQVAVDQSNLEVRRFAVKPYLQEVIISLKPQLKKTSHTLILEGDEAIEIESYPGAFSQIATNLVMNSLIHGYQSGKSGKLSFVIKQQQDRIEIEYTDDGQGINKENLPRVFEPFFTTARNRGGSGLGLHLVYNLVTQKLQGNIKVQSQEGSGTIFNISLPCLLSKTSA